MTRRAVGVGATAFVAVVLCAVSAAWACTNFARVDAISPSVGGSGSAFTLRGAGVGANTTVDLRWNGLDGPVLGQAVSDKHGNFTVAGAVPSDAPGVYSIVAVAGQTGVGRTAFEITSPSVVAPPSAPQIVGGREGADSRLWSGYRASAAGLDAPSRPPDAALLLGVGILVVGAIALLAGARVLAGRRARPVAVLGATGSGTGVGPPVGDDVPAGADSDRRVTVSASSGSND